MSSHKKEKYTLGQLKDIVLPLMQKHPDMTLNELAEIYPQNKDAILSYKHLHESILRFAKEMTEKRKSGMERIINIVKMLAEAQKPDMERIENELLPMLGMTSDNITDDIAEAYPQELIEFLDSIIENQERFNIDIVGTPRVKKRGPGRPTTKNRQFAYHYIYTGRMSLKQAFDWYLEREGIKPSDDDDYNAQFKSFKNAYRAWESRRKNRKK